MRKTFLLCLLVLFGLSGLMAKDIKGIVTDSISGETLIGATVMAGSLGTVTDQNGEFRLQVPEGELKVICRYIGYNDWAKTFNPDGFVINIEMSPIGEELGEVVVVANIANNTETAVVRQQRESAVVQSGMSSQQIQKTQDKDASEAIRRIPGISIIDDKYVMVRGLSQRYNNVWINSGAVPSSEADSRAFSFDLIPAGQIENMTIVKSPSPEYPSDFTGGFILVNTKQTVSARSFNISATAGYNDNTTFKDMLLGRGRHLSLGALTTYAGHNTEIDPIRSGIDNDWTLRQFRAMPEMKASASYAKTWRTDDNTTYGLISTVNFSNGYKRYLGMENSLFGPYDISNDKPIYLRRATDNQYNRDMRIGAMLNLSVRPHGGSNYYEWNNIFNLLTKNRYSERYGLNAQPDSINNSEYYYSSRATYNTQINGKHSWENYRLDWSGSYSFANRRLPDRRMIERTDRTDNRMGIYRISREFTDLDEHIASVNANIAHDFDMSTLQMAIKGGVYGEYRTRQYRARELQYGWQPDNMLPQDWMFDPDVPGHILIKDNYGPDKLFVYEEVNLLNSHKAHQIQAAGYISLNLKWDQLRIFGGVRYENCTQVLGLNTRQFEQSLQNTTYRYNDIFPSVNVVYVLPKQQQVRLAYGRSVNRPEFRELSPSVYYDFDLGSSVMGNYDLKAAYIQNVDFRYEWYPSVGEQVSLALFYKHFTHPIEWTYTVAGGTDLVYSYINAKGANNYGIELDVRKSLGFVGLENFSLSFNASLIKSRVQFDKGTNNIDRPMQGQSPYLVNASLFYNPSRSGWTASLMYNVIGKRIIGVGNRYGNASDGSARTIPNSYEMPRNVIDVTIGKKTGYWDIKIYGRDLLAQPFVFKQYEDVVVNGKSWTVCQTNRKYRPGRNFHLSVGYSF